MKNMKKCALGLSCVLLVQLAGAGMVSGSTLEKAVSTLQGQIQSVRKASAKQLQQQRADLANLVKELQGSVQQQLAKQSRAVNQLTSSIQKQFQAQDKKMAALQQQLLGQIKALQKNMPSESKK